LKLTANRGSLQSVPKRLPCKYAPIGTFHIVQDSSPDYFAMALSLLKLSGGTLERPVSFRLG
jgi:hypothetical protein